MVLIYVRIDQTFSQTDALGFLFNRIGKNIICGWQQLICKNLSDLAVFVERVVVEWICERLVTPLEIYVFLLERTRG